MLKHLLNALDFCSEITGLTHVRYALPMASNSDEFTLNMLGYKQTNSYTCGVAAGYAVTSRFNPQVTYKEFFAAVGPSPERGSDPDQVQSALLKFGVCSSFSETLEFDYLVQCIQEGHPVIAGRQTEYGEDHWVVLYGYGIRPARVFVMGRSHNPLLPEEMLWSEFKQSFDAVNGPAITCWGDKAQGSKIQRLRLSNPNQQ